MMALRQRARILLVIFLGWAVLISVRLFYYTIYARSSYLERGNELAWRHGTIPASRGRILDKDGRPLAWTERHFDLYLLDLPETAAQRERLKVFLRENDLPTASVEELSAGRCLASSLSPPELLRARDLVESFPGVQVLPRLRRITVDYSEVRELIGDTELIDGRICGISGMELSYDERLRGVDGEYLVMRDRNSEWIPGTWKEIVRMRAGEDVVIERKLSELRSGVGLDDE